MHYSVRRLTPEQRAVLDAVSIFQTPFRPEFAVKVLDDEEQASRHLQTLLRLKLLNRTTETFKEGTLELLSFHAMLHWYVQHDLPERDVALTERYGKVYLGLAAQADQITGGADQDSALRFLIHQSLPDGDAALQYLPSALKSSLAYYLARRYHRLGQNRRAVELYENALEIDQTLGDIREVAVTQNAMANVLVQQGKVEEAMHLYAASLQTYEQLGDVREVAVTQNAMADVLVQQGKVEEAMHLYAVSLQTKQQLGDIRGVAVTQNAMANVLVQQGKVEEAMHLYAASLQTYEQLGDVREVAVTQVEMCQVLFLQGAYQRALALAWEAYVSLSSHTFVPDAAFVQDLLITVKSQIMGSGQFDTIWDEVIRTPQPEWLRVVEAKPVQKEEDNVSELLQAVRDFVNAEDWEASRQVVDAQKDVLFLPEVETLFEQTITQAQAVGEQRAVKMLELHLEVLRRCKADGIAETFKRLTERQEQEQDDELPFDAALIPESIAAIVGSPQEKMTFAQSLMTQAAQTPDEGLQALYQAIQLALFSHDLTHLADMGRNLKGVYRQAWEAIVVGIETGGVDPELLGAIVQNTRAVLGPVAEKRSEWRSNLADIRNSATAQGAKQLVLFLDAVIALLDADGNTEGLGDGLVGVYTQLWQMIMGEEEQE